MYKIKITKSAYKQLHKYDLNTFLRIFNGIAQLANNPFDEQQNAKKLIDYEGYRLRIGDYRILYTIDVKNEELQIKVIAHRKDAY